jgi:hypothetical protein
VSAIAIIKHRSDPKQLTPQKSDRNSGHFAALFLAFFTADLTALSFAALPRLQLRHRVWRFFSVVNPPLDTGMIWSISNRASFAPTPQALHLNLSRTSTSNRSPGGTGFLRTLVGLGGVGISDRPSAILPTLDPVPHPQCQRSRHTLGSLHRLNRRRINHRRSSKR